MTLRRFIFCAWLGVSSLLTIVRPCLAQQEGAPPPPSSTAGAPVPPAAPAPGAQPAPTPGAPPPAPAGVQPPAIAPPPVIPAASGEVNVIVSDGAVFRGVLVEKIPGQYVTLKLPTGEFRRILWPSVVRIDGDVSVRPKTHVRFRADHEGAELEQYLNSGDWVSLCKTPCRGWVTQGTALRVGGPKIQPSEPFKVPPGREQMQIDADAKTKSKRIWGAVLGVGGGGVFLIGSSIFTLGVANDATATENGQARELTDRERRNLRITGAVMMGAGAAVGITGLVMLLNSESEAKISKRTQPAKRRAASPGVRLTPAGLVF